MGVVKDPVTISGQPFNTTFQWCCDTLEGWESTAPLEMVFQANGNADGAILGATSRAKEKPLTAGGAVVGSDRANAETLMQQLIALFPRDVEIPVDRQGKRAFAYLYDTIALDLVTPRGFRWTAPLLEADPFRYSITTVAASAGIFTGQSIYRTYDPAAFYRTYTSGTYRTYTTDASPTGLPLAALLVNEGDTRSRRVTVTVQGPLVAGDWRVVNETTGEVLVGNVTVDTGRTLVLDTNRGVALLDGNDVTDRMFGDWPTLVPGANTIRLLAGTTNAVANIAVTALSAYR